MPDSAALPTDHTAPDAGSPSTAAASIERLERLLDSTELTPQAQQAIRIALLTMRVLATEASVARERYDGLFNALPDPVSIIDADGIVLDLNRAGVAAYGRPREEIVGQPIGVINPDLPRDHMGPVWEALDAGGCYKVEVTNMRADGTRFPVEVHSALLNDGTGQRRLVAVARDLSGRSEVESRYRALMEAIDVGVVVQGAEGRFLSGNPAALRILGISSGQLLAEALSFEHWLVIDAEGRRMQIDEMPPVRALRQGITVDSSLLGVYHRERRQLIWLNMTSVPQFGPNASTPHQVISLFSDTTALKRDSTLFDRAQQLAQIGGWEWDVANDLLYLTEEAGRILGTSGPQPRSMAELLGMLHPDDVVAARASLERLCREGGSVSMELRGSGNAGWLRLIGEADAATPMYLRITGTLQDISERKLAEELLRAQARTDPLTGLLNRDGILGELSARLDRRDTSGLALLYVDLDRFKLVNDVLGHNAGDQLLLAAAKRLQKAVGRDAVLARFGGDEFLALVDGSRDPDLPARLAQAITQAFGESFRFGGEEFTITTSVGMATSPEHGRTPQQLINNADAAMYDAKRRGRNNWQAFSPALAEIQRERLRVETQLRRALDNNEFRLVYQPQVELSSGRVIGAEALIRWRNHSLGEIRPDRFINHAETTGDIVRIGAWTVREACRQMRVWRDAGIELERIAVNVSYRQLLTDDLPNLVEASLAEFDLPGTLLELEFTERVLIEDAAETLRTFHALRQLGVMLTIDDFGEGYSALNYLRRLPIHGLKLSHAFMRGVPDNGSDVAICQAVLGVARSMRLAVVGEGVESVAQRDFLIQGGAQVAQGFLYSPGLPARDFETWFRNHVPTPA